MTARSREDNISAGLPPGRQALAGAIAELYRHLAVATLTEAAELLASRNWRKGPSEISRYRSGKRKPPLGFVKLLHALAIERAERGAVRLSLAELLEIHSAAEPRLCRTCTPLRKENERLRRQYGRLLPEQDHQSPTVGRPGTTPLPVPSGLGDRQRSARDLAAARQVAATAANFHESGQTSYAVSWLQDASTSLTPLECAASIALLRQQEARLADTAIGIHGRNRTEKDVIRIALELHELGLPDDAGAILRASIG